MTLSEMMRRMLPGRPKADDAARQEKQIRRARQQAAILRERGRAEGHGDVPGGG